MLRVLKSASISLLVLATTAAPAVASPKLIPKREIYRDGHLEAVATGVSNRDEQLVVVSADTSGREPTLVTRFRGAGGSLSVLQELSRTTGALLPNNIEFNAAGATFLSWPNATTGVRDQHVFREPGGLFSVPDPWPDDQCLTSTAVRFLPTGIPSVACVGKSGIAPKNNVVITTDGDTSAGANFSSLTTLQSPVADQSMRPLLDVGPDGTRAVAWGLTTGAVGLETTSIMLAVAPPGAAFGTPIPIASVPLSTGGFAQLNDLAVLADGRVVAVLDRSDGSLADHTVVVRNTDGTRVSGQLPAGTASSSSQVERDGSGALLLWTESAGLGATAVKVAPLATNAPGAIQTLDPGITGGVIVDDLKVASNGAAMVARRTTIPGMFELSAWVRPATGRPFAGPFRIAADSGMTSFTTAIDRHGSVAAAWTEGEDSSADRRAMIGGLDSAGPTLSRTSIPARLKARRSGQFKTTAIDPSGVKSVSWSFGDRRSANGSSARHAYRRPGRYTVTLTAIDGTGQKNKITRTLRVTR